MKKNIKKIDKKNSNNIYEINNAKIARRRVLTCEIKHYFAPQKFLVFTLHSLYIHKWYSKFWYLFVLSQECFTLKQILMFHFRYIIIISNVCDADEVEIKMIFFLLLLAVDSHLELKFMSGIVCADVAYFLWSRCVLSIFVSIIFALI